jgi:hypothetical protein
MTSPVIQGEGGAPVTHFSEFGGIDPTMDPELAAVRSSVSIVCTSIVVFLENNPLVPCEWSSTLGCMRLELVFCKLRSAFTKGRGILILPNPILYLGIPCALVKLVE